jgi:PAS domain S-box-containing protein
LVDSNIVGVLIWSFDGRILEANDAFLSMLQYGRDDLVSGGVRWTDLTPTEWREGDERAMADLRSTGTVQPYEKEFFRKDGSRVPVLIGGALFDPRENDGVAFALDLSERKRDEAEIRALKDQLYRENLALRDEVDRAFMFEEIVGSSKTLKTALSRIASVAPTDSTVFISGETGTGKELIARAVHKRSRRSARAFVSVNCAALAPTLISSELFGHGASASDAFHVVIPSMAGYGFSGKPTTPGWDPARMARASVELMKRLGPADSRRKAVIGAGSSRT